MGVTPEQYKELRAKFDKEPIVKVVRKGCATLTNAQVDRPSGAVLTATIEEELTNIFLGMVYEMPGQECWLREDQRECSNFGDQWTLHTVPPVPEETRPLSQLILAKCQRCGGLATIRVNGRLPETVQEGTLEDQHINPDAPVPDRPQSVSIPGAGQTIDFTKE